MPPRREFTTTKAGSAGIKTLCALEKSIFRPRDRFSRRRLRYLLSSSNTILRFCWAGKSCIGYGISLLSRLRNGILKGRIYSIGILPAYQAQGAGSVLLQAMEHDLTRVSVRFITLETKKGSQGATDFFYRHGYRVVEELPKYYARLAGVRMRKDVARYKGSPARK